MNKRDENTKGEEKVILNDNNVLEFLLEDPPNSQAFRNKFNVLPPKLSQAVSRPPSVYRHERQLSNHPFQFVNPSLRGRKLQSQDSCDGRKTPSNSTFYSRGDNYYHEVLLQWEQRWGRETINTVTDKLESKLKGLESVSFYSSEY